MVFTSIRDITPEEAERIRDERRKSQQAAITRGVFRPTGLRKDESVTVQLEGGFGMMTHPIFAPGNFSEEGGDETFYKYEFFVVEGNAEAGVQTGTHVTWYASRTYFLKIDPLMEKGHSLYKIKRVHGKGEKDDKGNPLPKVANYEITAADESDLEFAKLIGGIRNENAEVGVK